MAISLPFFTGLISSLIGISLPGLLNMTAAKICIQEGKTRAFVFALGAIVIIFLQTFISIMFAKFLNNNPDITMLFREIGLGIFLTLTFYFFWTSKKMTIRERDVKLKSKRSRFFLGLLLSAINLFPIPYYVFVSVTLASYDYFTFDLTSTSIFVFGSGVGAFIAFYCYIAFFKKLEKQTKFLINNMNYIIGSITGLVSILTLINIINYYW